MLNVFASFYLLYLFAVLIFPLQVLTNSVLGFFLLLLFFLCFSHSQSTCAFYLSSSCSSHLLLWTFVGVFWDYHWCLKMTELPASASQLVSLTVISPYPSFIFLIFNALLHHYILKTQPLYDQTQIPLGDFANSFKSFMPCIAFLSSIAAEKNVPYLLTNTLVSWKHLILHFS